MSAGVTVIIPGSVFAAYRYASPLAFIVPQQQKPEGEKNNSQLFLIKQGDSKDTPDSLKKAGYEAAQKMHQKLVREGADPTQITTIDAIFPTPEGTFPTSLLRSLDEINQKAGEKGNGKIARIIICDDDPGSKKVIQNILLHFTCYANILS